MWRRELGHAPTRILRHDTIYAAAADPIPGGPMMMVLPRRRTELVSGSSASPLACEALATTAFPQGLVSRRSLAGPYDRYIQSALYLSVHRASGYAPTVPGTVSRALKGVRLNCRMSGPTAMHHGASAPRQFMYVQ